VARPGPPSKSRRSSIRPEPLRVPAFNMSTVHGRTRVKPEEYRSKAEECLARASEAIDPMVRSAFEELARSYQHLAHVWETWDVSKADTCDHASPDQQLTDSKPCDVDGDPTRNARRTLR
jgi:hypothetical protein